MEETISTVLYDLLKDVIDTYPVLADVENAKMLALPYAVYKVKHSGESTKEMVRDRYSVGIFLAAVSYPEADGLAHKVRDLVYSLRGKEYAVSVVEYEIDFDAEDRRYVCELSFNLKKL